MYIYIHVHVYYICIYICIYTYMYILYACIYIYIYSCIWINMICTCFTSVVSSKPQFFPQGHSLFTSPKWAQVPRLGRPSLSWEKGPLGCHAKRGIYHLVNGLYPQWFLSQFAIEHCPFTSMIYLKLVIFFTAMLPSGNLT